MPTNSRPIKIVQILHLTVITITTKHKEKQVSSKTQHLKDIQKSSNEALLLPFYGPMLRICQCLSSVLCNMPILRFLGTGCHKGNKIIISNVILLRHTIDNSSRTQQRDLTGMVFHGVETKQRLVNF
ncbi:hypothetical protein V6Z11_A04G161400 [Gossypium hirsutum]